MAASSMTMTVCLLIIAGLAAVALGAPAPGQAAFNESPPSNKVIVDDDEYLSPDEKERIVAGLILQIARDFDEGYITQDELEGRSSVRHEDVARKMKDVSHAVQQKGSFDKTSSQTT